MSIDYSMYIGKGEILTQEEVNELNEFDQELISKFMEKSSDTGVGLTLLDAYCADPEYFIGEILDGGSDYVDLDLEHLNEDANSITNEKIYAECKEIYDCLNRKPSIGVILFQQIW